MTITTKFDSKCKTCGKALPVGTRVTWEKGVGVFCATCKPLAPAPVRASRPYRSYGYGHRQSFDDKCRCGHSSGGKVIKTRMGYSDSCTYTLECKDCGGTYTEWDE